MTRKRFFRVHNFFLALLLLLLVGLPMTVHAADGTMILAVSSTSVPVGDTVTVTLIANGPGKVKASANMEFTYDSSVFSFVSCNADGYTGGEGGSVTASGSNVQVKLRAISQGTAYLKVTGTDGVVSDTQEALDSMVAAGANISATGQGNTGNNGGESGGSGTDTSQGGTGSQSAEGGLEGLHLSVGELSPAFAASVLEYTATVPYETEGVEVTATPKDENAKVTIDGNTHLSVGENTMSVTVEAENGSKTVYEVLLTRQEQGAGMPGDTKEPEDGQEVEDTDGLSEEDYEKQYNYLNEEYGKLEKRYQEEKSFARKMMAILAFVTVVLIIMIINLLISRKQLYRELDQWGDEDEDDWKDEEKPGKRDEKRPSLAKRLRDSFRECEEDDWLDEEDDWDEDVKEPEWRKHSQEKPEPEKGQEDSGKSDNSPKKKTEIDCIDLDKF